MTRELVRFEGGRELEAALSQLVKHTTRKAVARRALKAVAEPIAGKMRALAPDDPATRAPYDLKMSIDFSSRQKSGRATKYRKESPSEVVVHIGPTKEGYPQALMQEFGTVHHAARPYMRPAWDGERGKVIPRISKIMWQEISAAVGRQERKFARDAKRAAAGR